MRPLPDFAVFGVPPALAADLLRAASREPALENQAYYEVSAQSALHDAVRAACPGGFDELAGEIRSRLEREPFCAVVRGLQFDEHNRVFIAVSRAFGDLVAPPYKKPRSQLVHYIEPATDILAGSAVQTQSERLHTDNADWPEPVAIISMLCVRPDAHGGGRSRVFDVKAFREEVAERLGHGAVQRLEEEEVPWQIAEYLGGGVVWRPILAADSMRWRRYTIDAALERGGATLPRSTVELLDAVEELIEGTDRAVEFLLGAGDLSFTANRRGLHSRTAISGDRKTSNRLMLRSWIRASSS